ncbi:G-protein coupled receptor family C group 5 member D isoform X1 [Osmerus eperlanus]|uniref:G-protein coupled receptor family C group 5 member D isoform X1 n=1 Tax=Osmerus eperlanus TaxID=29151 RepID=UPI002E1540CB
MWINTRMGSQFQTNPYLGLLFLLFLCLPPPSQTILASNTTLNNTDTTNSTSTATPSSSSPQTNTSSNSTSQEPLGCGAGLEPMYWYLCDRRAAWGIVVESLATLGFVVSSCLLIGLLFWTLWVCVSSRRRPRGIGGAVASMSLFLLSTAALFALTFAFVIRLTSQTCPTRLFLFGVVFALAFSCLLARGLALLGFGLARGRGEPCLALCLFLVQVIVATEWLIIVLVRDERPCEYSQGEFVMLLVYVFCLLAAALVVSLRNLCRSCLTYSYSYTGGGQKRGQTQATMLCLTLLLSVAIWVVWVGLLTRGNPEMGRRPRWDDPVLSVALVANGWVLLLGHGLAQIACLCRGAGHSREATPDFGGWASPTVEFPRCPKVQKEGRDNGSFENDGADRKAGRRQEPALKSPYESGFSMTEIDPDKDYTIPRPQTTITSEPYDEYYGHSLSD